MTTTTSNPPFTRPSFNPSFTPTFTGFGQDPTSSPTNGFSSIFQSPGGPPLILVCIAAGLLLGAFIGVLLMRRMRPPPIAQRGIGAAAFLAGSNQPLGEKPKLVDIHLTPPPVVLPEIDGEAGHGTGKEKLGEHGAWGSVSPFAAVYLEPAPSADRPRSLSPSAQSPSAPPSSSPRRNRTPLARLAARMDPRRRPSAHEPSAPAGAQPDARAVQLAVTVSMPSPRHPSHLPPVPKSGSSQDVNAPAHDNYDEAMPDCCIGTVVVSYGHDANAPSPATAPAQVGVPPVATS